MKVGFFRTSTDGYYIYSGQAFTDYAGKLVKTKMVYYGLC